MARTPPRIERGRASRDKTDSRPIASSEELRAQALLHAAHHLARAHRRRADPRELLEALHELPTAHLADFGPARELAASWSATELERRLLAVMADERHLVDVLADLARAEQSVRSLKQHGAVYTPYWLARRVCRHAQAHYRRLHRTGEAPRQVADLSAGVGAFLFALSEVFGDAAMITGSDRSALAVAYARLLGWAARASFEVRSADTLFVARDPAVRLPRARTAQRPSPNGQAASPARYDLLIGNPPYVRSALLPRDYADALRRAYPSVAAGNFDLSVAFVEHAIEHLAPGGVASYILTHKFMSASYGEAICRRLASEVQVLNLEDFADYQIFKGYTTYTCVLTFAKQPPARRFSVTRFPRGVDAGRDPGPGETESLPALRLKTHPWEMAGDGASRILRKLRDGRHPLLSSLCGGILQGMRTGASSVFVLSRETARALEPALTRPFVGGEQIRRLRLDGDALYLVYPYELTAPGVVRPIPEPRLAREYPRTFAHLSAQRALLNERSRDAHAAWYEFSRAQNLDLASRRKVLVREMLPRAEFAADYAGSVTFCAGYALDARELDDETLTLVTAMLCTPTMEFALRHSGTALQSGWFRLLKHHLARVRLPLLTPAARREAVEFSARLAEDPSAEALWQALDGVVARAFGLTTAQGREVQRYLSACHRRSLGGANADRARGDEGNAPPAVRAAGGGASSPEGAAADRRYEPVRLSRYAPLHRERCDLGRLVTFGPNKDAPLHRWYRYTQGFSGALVEQLIAELEVPHNGTVLDPFCGCGTTLVVCRQRGIGSIGVEVSPLMSLIAGVKVAPWCAAELDELLTRLRLPGPSRRRPPHPTAGGTPVMFQQFLEHAFADEVLQQIRAVADYIRTQDAISAEQRQFLLVGLLAILEDLSQIRKHGSHYRYLLKSENAGLQKLNIRVAPPTTDVRDVLFPKLRQMVEDVRRSAPPEPLAPVAIHTRDVRQLSLEPGSVSTVITSPPYLNRNNYIAQQKGELALLGWVHTKDEYKRLVQATFRSHVEAKLDAEPTSRYSEVQKILEALELTHNNNPKIPHMVAGYFEDLGQLLHQLSSAVRVGGRAAFVVGNTRWGGVVVPVDHLLLRIAEDYGFVGERVLVTRMKGNSPQQMKQFGRIAVRESIVILRRA